MLLVVVLNIHCMLLIRSDAGRCLCVRYRILLRLPLFLINKCTEAVILADIACSSPSHVTGLAGHLVAGQGKFVQSSGAVWCMGAQWARSLVILILSVSLALTGSHTQISCNHGQPIGPTDLDRIEYLLFYSVNLPRTSHIKVDKHQLPHRRELSIGVRLCFYIDK